MRSGRIAYERVATELDKTDPQWRWEEIEAARATVPPAENSALVIQAAARKWPQDWRVPDLTYEEPEVRKPDSAPCPGWSPWPGSRTPDAIAPVLPPAGPPVAQKKTPVNVRINDKQLARLVKEWQAAAEVLAEARRLRDMPRGRIAVTWARNPMETSLTYLDTVRKLGELLRFDALVLSEQENPDAAMASLCAILNMQRCLIDDPTTYAFILRFAQVRDAIEMAERVLSRGQPGSGNLKEFARLLDREEGEASQALRPALRGERASTDRYYECLADGTTSFNSTCASWAPAQKALW